MTMGQEILEVLLSRLSKKEVMPYQLPGLLRDVLNIISSTDTVTVEGINVHLSMLGWQEDIVDEFTLEIMKTLIEDVDDNIPAGQYALAGSNNRAERPPRSPLGREGD